LEFDEGLAGSPNDLDSGALKVTVLSDLGDFPQAKELLETLAGVHGEHRSIVLVRGHLHMAEGQFNQDIDAFLKAHALEETPESMSTLYRALRTAGRADEGIKLLQSWILHHADDIGTRHALGQGLVSLNRFDEARDVYEVLRANGIEDIVLLNNLAVVYQRLGDERALTIAKLAYEKAPEASSILDTYGWILTENGKPGEGLTMLRDAFARSSTGPEIRFHTGLAWMKMGKNAEAIVELEAALRSENRFADFGTAEAMLEKLRGGYLARLIWSACTLRRESVLLHYVQS
jgi:tetratricopeptide (TPR) repeat protein